MFPEQLKKILNLIKKTHDRVVIFDGSNPEDSYVIMDLDNYMDTAVKTEKPAPVAVSSVVLPTAVKTEISPKLDKSENLTEEDLTDKINREISLWKNQENAPYLAEENKAKKGWQIPPVVKNKAQEVE
jgi:hypothetical protein